MKFILTTIVAVLLLPIVASSNEIIGTWIQHETDRCGFGNVFIFREDNRYELSFSSTIVYDYKIQDNLLVSKDLSLSVDPPTTKFVYFISDNLLILQRVISEKPLKLTEKAEFTRLTPRASKDINDLIGKWKALNNDIPMVTYEFTNSGKKLFSLNSKNSVGVYVVVDGKLRFGTSDDKMFEFNISFEDDKLVLAGEKEKQTYEKIK